MSSENMVKLLDWSYNKSLNGLSGKSVDETALEYKNKYPNTEIAINHVVHSVVLRSTTTGFVTGFGGFSTMPVTVPADISAVIYNQLRMIAIIAILRGYNPHDEEVRTIAYTCLAGMSASDILKKTGVTIGKKMSISALKRIPGKTLTRINQAVGFRLVTKFGTKGSINLVKAVPVIGAIVGGSFDGLTTQAIAKITKKNFVPLS